MKKLSTKLKYSFINAFRISFLDYFLSILIFLLVLASIYLSKDKLMTLSFFFIFPLISSTNLSGIHKNLNIFVMINFPCTLKEILRMLFLKYSIFNFSLNIVVLIIAKAFLPIDFPFFLLVIVFLNFYSFLGFIILQVYLRKSFEVDLIGLAVINTGAVFFILILFFLNYLSYLLFAGSIVVFLVLYIIVGLPVITKLLLTKIFEILESNG